MIGEQDLSTICLFLSESIVYNSSLDGPIRTDELSPITEETDGYAAFGFCCLFETNVSHFRNWVPTLVNKYEIEKLAKQLYVSVRKFMNYFTLDEVLMGLILSEKAFINYNGRFQCNGKYILSFIAMGCILVHKAISVDKVYTNQFWANVLNVKISVLNSSEIEVLKLLDYRVSVSPEEVTLVRLLMNKLH
ncbi:MAG: hypothetical protein WC939_01530 [Acholeplasmataceae bacterium]